MNEEEFRRGRAIDPPPAAAPAPPQEARLATLALVVAAETAELLRAATRLPADRLLALALAVRPVGTAVYALLEAALDVAERARRPTWSASVPSGTLPAAAPATVDELHHREPGEGP